MAPRTFQTTSTRATSNHTTQTLTVIELFQSQGCNSCPPTNSNLLSLLNQPLVSSDVLLLTFEVTYWDYLGWRDVFGSKAFDQRQRDYVHRLQLRSAFTPQVVVNGVASGVGNTKGDLNRVLQQGKAVEPLPISVSVQVEEGSGRALVFVGAAEATAATGRIGHELEVWLVTYDPSQVDVDITRGENAGQTLPHVNVVKGIERLGTIDSGKGGEFVMDERRRGLRRALLVQDGRGGGILGAARVD